MPWSIKGELLNDYVLRLLEEDLGGRYEDKFKDFKDILTKAYFKGILTKAYSRRSNEARHSNEANVIDHILRPVFQEVLGYDYWHREERRGRGFRPDILVGKGDRPLLLVEAKSVKVDFDRPSGGRSPARQVKNYLFDYEIRKTVSFGILSNGIKYRLYYAERLDDYVEFDFSGIWEERSIIPKTGDLKNTFRIFYHLLNADNFPYNLEEAILRSEGYRFRVSEKLTERVFYTVIPLIAREFYNQGERDLNVLKEKTLIFLYRLLFLFYAEDRELINFGKYSIKDLREKVKNNSDFSNMSYVLWENLKTAFRIMDRGDEGLNIPKYNGGLFRDDGFFDRFRLNDRVIAEVLRALSYYEGNYINYRTLSVRNLGSIYETVLEYDLRLNGDNLTLEKGEGKETKRKLEGVYYTPDFVVKFIVRNTLGPKVDEIVRKTKREFERIDDMGRRELLDEFKRLELDPKAEGRDKTSEEMREELKRLHDPIEKILNLKVLDPATGSGHFLVEAVTFLVDSIQTVINKMEREVKYTSKFANYSEDMIKRIVLKRCIYGVDINPLAVELAKVSLWLHTFSTGLPLTFLDHHIKVGNTVVGYGLNPNLLASGDLKELQNIVRRINELNDARIEEVEKSEAHYKEYEGIIVKYREKLNKKLEKLPLKNYEDLRPFHFLIEFPDAGEGFDVVIGNPPYIRQERLRGIKRVFKELFGRTYDSRADIYVYFYNRGLELLKDGGYLGFITSNKFMRAAYGRKLRKYISENYTVEKVIDFSGYRVFKEAMVDTAIFIIKKELPDMDHEVEVCKVSDKNLVFTEGLDYDEIERYRRRGKETVSIFTFFDNHKFLVPQSKAFTPDIFLIEDVKILEIKDKIEKVGRPLKDWNVRIYRGIITGFNKAFIIDTKTRDEILNNCRTEDERRRTEDLIRPILRGRDIEKWRYKWAGLWVILAKFGFYKKAHLYPAVVEYLSKYEKQLKNRGQCRYTRSGKRGNKDYPGQHHWLELDNNPTDEYLREFEKEKIVWQRVTQSPKFALVPKGLYCEATTHFITFGNFSTNSGLKFLLGILNSKFFKFAFYKFYMGGGIEGEIKGTFIGKFPIPPITPDNQPIAQRIEDLVDEILSITQSPDYDNDKNKQSKVEGLEREIDKLVYRLYGLTDEEVKVIEDELS